MAINRGRGWRRIGIVLSVIWFIGLGGYIWTSEMGHVGDFYTWQLKMCSATKNSAEKLRECQVRASTFHHARSEELRKGAWMLLLMDLGTIAIGWLAAWLIVSVVRWINRGFASA